MDLFDLLLWYDMSHNHTDAVEQKHTWTPTFSILLTCSSTWGISAFWAPLTLCVATTNASLTAQETPDARLRDSEAIALTSSLKGGFCPVSMAMELPRMLTLSSAYTCTYAFRVELRQSQVIFKGAILAQSRSRTTWRSKCYILCSCLKEILRQVLMPPKQKIGTTY